MDPFKRTTLLMAQASMGLITSDEVRKESADLISQMQADPESQLPNPPSASDQTPDTTPAKNW